ncbi:MAG: MEKHLA domain-containing protein [Rubripirellula sp.]
MSPWEQHDWIDLTQHLLDSYHRLIGCELIDRQNSAAADAESLFQVPFVVVAHGTQLDPLLSYGNATALDLWEISIPMLLKTPSRETAEPVHRDERRSLLERTTRDGYVDDYRGIRISTTGKRFLIERATVWNVEDNEGKRIGQAATFDTWTPLEPNEPSR